MRPYLKQQTDNIQNLTEEAMSLSSGSRDGKQEPRSMRGSLLLGLHTLPRNLFAKRPYLPLRGKKQVGKLLHSSKIRRFFVKSDPDRTTVLGNVQREDSILGSHSAGSTNPFPAITR